MVDALERFLNWLPDRNLVWGPVLCLRFHKSTRVTWDYVLCVGSIVSIVEVCVFSLFRSLPIAFAANHNRIDHVGELLLSYAVAFANMTMAPRLSLMLQVVLGPLVLVPFAWAWNRRANRLNRETSVPQPTLATAPGVWPPPPDVPEGR